MDDRRRNFAPGYGRAAGLLALLTGVLAMHVLVFTPARMAHTGYAAAQAITVSGSVGDVSAAMHSPGRPATPSGQAATPSGQAATPSGQAATPSGRAATPSGHPGVLLAGIHRMTATLAPRDSGQEHAGMTVEQHTGTTAVQHTGMTGGSPAMHDMNTENGCGRGDCGMVMGGMHACVFILTVLMLLIGLALLGRNIGGTGDSACPTHTWLPRRGRPPPWAMPSLAELSILRI